MKKRKRIKYKNVFKFLLFVTLLILGIKFIFNLSITNIYIIGNDTLSDSFIMEVSSLKENQKLLKTPNYKIKKQLIKNEKIYDAKVYKKGTKLYIEVVENRPLFYNSNTSKTVMLDKTTTDTLVTPYLVNYIPDTIYDKFVDEMAKLDKAIIERISDIKYSPNEVDDERFYLTMSDGNYVYLTLKTFTKINNYVEMLKQFRGENGILYLDSGEYFEIKDS